MDQLLLFTLLGLGGGALTAAIALGVVLSFRGSGTINLAAGGATLFGAYTFYGLNTSGSLPFLPDRLTLGGPWPAGPAFVATLGVCALLGVAQELLVVRPLRTATPLAKLVASLGVLLILQAVVILRFGPSSLPAPRLLADDAVQMLGATVPLDRLVLTGLVIAVTAGLVVLYRFTRFGLATRAAGDDERAATLAGLSANNLSLVNTLLAWMIAGALGVLVAPLTELDPNQMVLVVVPALAAALLARFTSFVLACAFALGLGVLQSLVFLAQTQPWFPTSDGQAMPGVAQLLVFVVVVAAMFWRGKSLPTRGDRVEQRLPPVPQASRLAVPAIAVSAVCAVALVVLPFDYRQALILTIIGVTIALSLTVITGFVGQISFFPLALGGIAGLVLSRLATDAGIGFPLGPVIAVAVAVVVGVATASAALRVRGVQLAVVTLSGAVAVQAFVFNNPVLGGADAGSPVPPPMLFGIDLGPRAPFFLGDGSQPSPVLGLLVLVCALAACLLVANLRRSLLGRCMLAVRSNERAAAAAGINARNVKLAAFGISAGIAGLGGVLYGYNFGTVTGDRFGVVLALAFVAFVYVGGITTVLGAVLAGLIASGGLMSHVFEHALGIPNEYTLLISGVVLVFNVVLNPGGIAAQVTAGFQRKRAVRRARVARPPAHTLVEEGASP